MLIARHALPALPALPALCVPPLLRGTAGTPRQAGGDILRV